MITRQEILKALEDVRDPEIPTISVVDLGIVTDVILNEDKSVSVTMTPTFSGCPALKMLENMVKEKIESIGIKQVDVKTTFDVPWNTNMISPKGKEMLKKHGLAPPPEHNGVIQIDILSHVPCPYCSSKNTVLKSPFGPTLCRSLHYCNNCRQAFEQFKPVE
ncbi:MAG: phenylacetate-CoA oxygenase subunit PaaJ [Ignavibacteriae bacterium]|nr:MAG: phenylacetate-CoA oxygenase subunit PaaJ [Ignavibacteriota bacterium]